MPKEQESRNFSTLLGGRDMCPFPVPVTPSDAHRNGNQLDISPLFGLRPSLPRVACLWPDTLVFQSAPNLVILQVVLSIS